MKKYFLKKKFSKKCTHLTFKKFNKANNYGMRKIGLVVFGILDSPFFSPLIQLLLECFQMSPRFESTYISMEHGYPKKTTILLVVLEILDTSILG